MRVNQNNFKVLEPDAARGHLDRLAFMLTMVSDIMQKRLPRDGGSNTELHEFLKKVSDTLNAFVLKNRLEAMKANSDIRLSCTIDPSDSGFPIFVRDFKFLTTDKQNTLQELEKLPDDAHLVDDALFLLFRGHFPKDVVFQKLARNYYTTLSELDMPEHLSIGSSVHLKHEDRMHYCKKSFERLDDHHNLPRFYTAYLKIPEKTYPKPDWEPAIDQAIREGFSTVTALELGYLAPKIEVIEGVQLEYLERFDIGPFYSMHTENGEAVSSLIDSPDDCIMMFNKSTIVRTGQEERAGLKERLKGWRSGDTHLGEFSPPIESPLYILMPHRLIQKVHNLDIKLKDRTRMFGVTPEGEIYD
jgi:hypothetical protein